MDESFDNLRWYSNSFNISPFVPVVVGMAVMHHALLTSLQVNMSHFSLKLFLSPIESDATTALGQLALLQYVTQQCHHSGGSGEDSSGSQSWHWGHEPDH